MLYSLHTEINYTEGGHASEFRLLFFFKDSTMKLLEISEISHAYGDKILFEDSGLTLQRGERMGVTGENGAGKSTLLKICLEEVIPDKGRVCWNQAAKVGYLDQHALLDPQENLLGYLRSAFATLYEVELEMNKIYSSKCVEEVDHLTRAFEYQSMLEDADFVHY